MKRRDLLKNITLGTAGVAIGSQTYAHESPKHVEDEPIDDAANGQLKEEIAYEKELRAKQFFNKHEMATIAVLADIIVPKDNVSGSATDAKVPEFIEFIVKDMPGHQVPMRGGLMWLDTECKKQFNGKKFIELSKTDQLKMIDQIAYPATAELDMKPGVEFFNKMRDLTLTGFYTSEMGVKDLGYKGNTPNQWDGVPAEVLKKYKLSYTYWESFGHVK